VTYLFECPECRVRREIVCSVAERNEPRFCFHANSVSARVVLMERKLTVPIVNANLEKDKPENQIGRVLTHSNSREDWLRREKAELENYERGREDWDTSVPKEVTLNDIDVSGAWQAANSGPEALERWRTANIAPDDFAAVSCAE
jgi:hypothetical protein